MTTEAFIYEAIRTPRGRGKQSGSLHSVKPISLVTGLIDELRTRFPDLDEDRISDLILGVVSPLGDQGMDIARIAATDAGLPDTVGGVQINRFCASGLEAVNMAAQKVRSGWDEMVIAGGVESMSRVKMGSDGGPWVNDPATNYDNYVVPQGIGADLIASIEGFSRDDVDAYAVRSQDLAAKAWGRWLLRQVRRPGQGHQRHHDPRQRRAHASRHHGRESCGPGAGVRDGRRHGRLRRRRAAEVPLGREDQPRPPRRQQLRHRRRCRAAARRQRGRRQGDGSDPRAPASSRPPPRVPTRRSC